GYFRAKRSAPVGRTARSERSSVSNMEAHVRRCLSGIPSRVLLWVSDWRIADHVAARSDRLRTKEAEGYRNSAARSSPAPLHASRPFLICSNLAERRSGAHSSARSSEREST